MALKSTIIKISKLHLNTANFAYWQINDRLLAALRCIFAFLYWCLFAVDMKAWHAFVQFSLPRDRLRATWFKFQFQPYKYLMHRRISFHQNAAFFISILTNKTLHSSLKEWISVFVFIIFVLHCNALHGLSLCVVVLCVISLSSVHQCSKMNWLKC